MRSDGDIPLIDLDSEPRDITEIMDRIQSSDAVIKKIVKVYENIADAAEKASEFMVSALSDDDVPSKDKIVIAQYVLNRILGTPTNRLNMQVDSRSVSTSLHLKTPSVKLGQAYNQYTLTSPEQDIPKAIEHTEVEDAVIVPIPDAPKEN